MAWCVRAFIGARIHLVFVLTFFKLLLGVLKFLLFLFLLSCVVLLFIGLVGLGLGFLVGLLHPVSHPLLKQRWSGG